MSPPSPKSYDHHDCIQSYTVLPNPTIPRGTASDGRIEDAASEEPNINAVPPPTTGKFTETNKLNQINAQINRK